MNFHKHLRLFIGEHLWVITLFSLSSFFSISFLFMKQYGNLGDIFYYSCMPLVVLILFLLYRLYTTWNYYELLLLHSDIIDDYILQETKNYSEKNLQQLLFRIRQLYNAEKQEKENWKKNQKLMIYQWVHQIKTPLSVINLIIQNHKQEADYQKIAKMESEIQYDLNQLLSIYRLDQIENDFKAERLELYELVRSSVNELKNNFIEHEIYPKLNIPKELFVYTDKKWIKFVLYQLLTNSIKYSPKSSSIYMKATQNNGKISLTISDCGCGIASEDLSRIFDLFFTGENGRQFGESSGIGLYMVKKITDYLGHSIDVTSQLHKGSSFIIKF